MAECSICFDDEYAESLSLPCGCSACSDCLLDFLSSAASSTSVLQCFNCSKVVDETQACSILRMNDRHSDAEKILSQNFESFLTSEPNAKRCPHCSTAIVGCSAVQNWDCLQCNGEFCSWCDKACHKKACGPTRKFRLLLSPEEKADQLFSDYVRNNAEHSISCPGCKTLTFRSSGCNHMTCAKRGCGAEFCFLCGASHYNPATGNYHFDESQICNDIFLPVEEYKRRLEMIRDQNGGQNQSNDNGIAAKKNRKSIWGPIAHWSEGQKLVLVSLTSPLWLGLSPVIAATVGTVVICKKIHQRVK